MTDQGPQPPHRHQRSAPR